MTPDSIEHWRLRFPLIADYVSDNGRSWTPTPRPVGLRKRAKKACFSNACSVAADPRWTLSYCEGFALLDDMWASTSRDSSKVCDQSVTNERPEPSIDMGGHALLDEWTRHV